MSNPYEPTPTGLHESRSRLHVWDVVVFLGFAGFVALNYATAMVPYIVPINNFMHAMFVAMPIAVLLHLRPLWAAKPLDPVTQRLAPSLGHVILAGLMLAAFALPWLAWFSPNPFEHFVLQNRYFGKYGWVLWVLLLCVGLLPLFNILRLKRSTYWMIASMALIAHSFNAHMVWHTSHA